jgi:hypothetical protein
MFAPSALREINNLFEEGRWQPLDGFFHAVIYGMKVWQL